MINYSEILCQSVDMLASAALNDNLINKDITIICEIKEVIDRNNGEYLVNYQMSNFIAYSQNQTYRVGDTVYVTVPQGDFSKQKFIQGKEVSDSDNSFIFTRPFDNFIDLTDNLIENIGQKDGGWGLVAKGEILETEPIISYEFDDFTNYQGFTILGLQADFKTLISSLEPSSGIYGINLKVYQTEDSSPTTLTFSSKDMYGDTYNFQTWFGQEVLFDISSFDKIKKIEVSFFQNSFSFQNFPTNEEDIEIYYKINNLFVNNIKFYLGYLSSEIKNDFAYIFSTDSLEFPFQNDTLRELKLRWIQKIDGKYVQIKENSQLDYEINWYNYQLGAPSSDEYSGAHWVKIDSGKNFALSIIPSSLKKEEKYKVIVMYQNVPIRSNIITFTNENDVINDPTIDAIYSTKLVTEDGSNGQYFIYDENNESLYDEENNILSDKLRTLTIWYKDSQLTDWDEGTEIEWEYPIENTMIKVQGTNEINLTYKLSSRYNSSNGNNTIIAKYKKDGVTYRGAVTFNFGQASSSGTEFVVNIYEKNIETGLRLNKNTSTVLKAQMQDNKGNQIQSETPPTYNWSLISGEEYVTLVPNNDECEVKWTSIPNNQAIIIVQVEVDDFGDFKLYYKYPICVFNDSKASRYIGPNRIEYKSNGEDPIYYKGEIKLINNLDQIQENAVWEIIPSRIASITNNNRLNPPETYSKKDYIPYALIAKVNNEIVFIAPIVVDFNTYSSSLVNSWNGKELIVDYENSSITSKMIAAGSKNNQNQFSGVIMGDCIGDESLKYTGLYGFCDGAQAFAFKEDGTAFIGLPGYGRIEFDGDSGLIESGNYNGTRVSGEIKDHNFITAGSQYDLMDGTFKTPFFEIDKRGAYFNGAIHATSLTLSDQAAEEIIKITPENAKYAEFLGTASRNYTYSTLKDALDDLQYDIDNIDLSDYVTSRDLGDLAFMDERDLGLEELAYLDVNTLQADYINADYINALEINAGSIKVADARFYQGRGNSGSTTTDGARIDAYGNPYIIVTYSGARMTDGSGYIGVWNGSAHSSDDLSDRRLKSNIDYDLKNKYNDFYMKLKPVSFTFNKFKKPYKYIGFIAQEVEQALYESGLNNEDFGGIWKIKSEEVEDGILYSLKYQNFIALNTMMIQDLKNRVDILEREIKENKNE